MSDLTLHSPRLNKLTSWLAPMCIKQVASRYLLHVHFPSELSDNSEAWHWLDAWLHSCCNYESSLLKRATWKYLAFSTHSVHMHWPSSVLVFKAGVRSFKGTAGFPVTGLEQLAHAKIEQIFRSIGHRMCTA